VDSSWTSDGTRSCGGDLACELEAEDELRFIFGRNEQLKTSSLYISSQTPLLQEGLVPARPSNPVVRDPCFSRMSVERQNSGNKVEFFKGKSASEAIEAAKL